MVSHNLPRLPAFTSLSHTQTHTAATDESCSGLTDAFPPTEKAAVYNSSLKRLLKGHVEPNMSLVGVHVSSILTFDSGKS